MVVEEVVVDAVVDAVGEAVVLAVAVASLLERRRRLPVHVEPQSSKTP